MIKLNKTYTIGVMVMFYEIEMLKEYIDSCIQMTNDIENKDNLHFHFCWNQSQYFEDIDTDKTTIKELQDKFYKQMDRLNTMKQHELNELCIALRHEIYTLRRTINEQNKDIIKKDRLISNLAKKVNNNNKQLI